MATTSETLLERVRRPGDRAAWLKFVEIYTPLLFCWASRLRLTRHEAADLVQEVLLLLVRKLPEFQYRHEGTFRGWLKKVATNRWRAMARRREPGATVSLEFQPEEPATPDDAEAFWESEYRQRLLQKLLASIRSDFEQHTWQAFYASVVESRSVSDVARDLGVTPAQIYDAKYRILRRLRRELTDLNG